MSNFQKVIQIDDGEQISNYGRAFSVHNQDLNNYKRNPVPNNNQKNVLSQSNASVRSTKTIQNLAQSIFDNGFTLNSDQSIRDLLNGTPNLVSNSLAQSNASRTAINSLMSAPQNISPLFNSSSLPYLNPDEYIPKRIKRMNIPQTTIIDRRTGQAIHTTYKTPYNYANTLQTTQQHVQDKNLVAKMNRLLIDGGWKYSSLLGAQNHNSKLSEKEAVKTMRDEDFPQVLTLISPQMRQNYRENSGDMFVHLVQCPNKVKLVHQTDSYGLSPTNSRYFVYGFFGLTKNLIPSLFGLGFARDKTLQLHKHQVYYIMLKAFIQANNQDLTQKRRQFLAKKAMFKKNRHKQPEEIPDQSFVFCDVFFAKSEPAMVQACEQIKIQFSLNFQLFPSFSQRVEQIKLKFKRHQISKDKAILQRGQQLIKKMIQSNNFKDYVDSIQQMNNHNDDFSRRMRKFKLEKLCLQHFQKRFLGFHVYQRYESPMIQYLNIQIVQKDGHTFKQFIENIIQQESMDLARVNKPFSDRYGLMNHNARLRKLVFIVQPNVMKQIMELYKIGESLKYQKDVTSLNGKYLIGSGKRYKKTSVQLLHHMWKCECGFQAKVGIPCSHLFRVLHCEKSTKYQDYINHRYKKPKISEMLQID